jgi:beta-glucanase (GH16 family)
MNRLLPTCLLVVAAVSLASAQTTPGVTSPNLFNEQTIKQWTLKGPLEPKPQQAHEDLPLTDQENKGGWVKFDPLWDDFDGTTLNAEKWEFGVPGWQGRIPAWFNPANISVHDGQLHITLRKEAAPAEMEKLGYHDYSTAAMHSRVRGSFGYYEVKARAMNSAGSSAFWFKREDRKAHPGWDTEIDVFELCGKNPKHDHLYHMTLHIFETPQEKRHWQVGASWVAPWRFSEDFHVYGFEWGPRELRWYVDGTLVRTVENTHWQVPLLMIFDSEAMPEWFGMPEDADLPSTYDIEYVHAWTARSAPAAAPAPGGGEAR